MGYIVYNTRNGRAERYYKQERTAKAQATKLNNDHCYQHRSEVGGYCAIPYAAYEGVLMGIKGENLRYWTWLNGR